MASPHRPVTSAEILTSGRFFILKHESPETDDMLMLRCFQSLLTFQNVKKKLKNILFTVIKIREIQQIFAAGTTQGSDHLLTEQ